MFIFLSSSFYLDKTMNQLSPEVVALLSNTEVHNEMIMSLGCINVYHVLDYW